MRNNVNKLYIGNSFVYLSPNAMSDYLEKLRPEAVYFKLTSKGKYGDAVSVADVIQVLKNLSESYLAYVDAEYSKINTLQDPKRLKQVTNGLIDENSLMVVDLKFESCGMAVSPDIVTYKHSIPNIKDPLKWKNNTFSSYKNDVLKADFNDNSYIAYIEKRFNPVERQKIFKPIIDGILKNDRSNIVFGIGSTDYDIHLRKPTNKNYESLVPATQHVMEDEVLETSRTSLARVEIKSSRGKDKVKTLELFEDVHNIILPIDRLDFDDNIYIFKYPLYCELIHESEGYILENQQLGIFANGNTIEEAKLNFAEEFDFVFDRYNTLSNDKLTDDVINIKSYLNSILEK